MKTAEHSLDEIAEYVDAEQLRTIMVLSHDSKFAIARKGGLIHRDRADMRWFRRITTGRACVVGSKTYPEVHELPNRIWVRLSKSGQLKTGYNSDSIQHGITFARVIARSKSMDRCVVIAGGAIVYNDALDKGLPDAIIATVWERDLDGDRVVNDYTADGRYRQLISVPLDTQGDVAATVRLYVRTE